MFAIESDTATAHRYSAKSTRSNLLAIEANERHFDDKDLNALLARSSDRTHRVAVLSPSDPDREFVSEVIRRMEHHVIEFREASDLAESLSAKQEYSLVIAAFEGNAQDLFHFVKFFRFVTEDAVPLIFLLPPEQLLAFKYLALDAINDFLVMPYDDSELIVRTSAVLSGAAAPKSMELNLEYGPYKFVPMNRTLQYKSKSVKLRPREYDLATFLFRNAGIAVSREQILHAVWKEKARLQKSRTVDVHVTRLRHQLSSIVPKDLRITSIRGLGYKLFY